MSSQARGRLKFGHVEERERDGQRSTEVTLTYNGRPVVGRSHHAEEAGGRTAIRHVALATLDAIEGFVDRRFTCDLQEVDLVHALGKELVVLLINIDFEGRRIQLFGSCRAGDKVAEAAAKAALDATNRYIDIVLSQSRDDG